jgi:hypothetical protein
MQGAGHGGLAIQSNWQRFLHLLSPAGRSQNVQQDHPGLSSSSGVRTVSHPRSAVAKANIRLSLKRLSLLENVSVWISATGKRVLEKAACLNFIAVHTAKYDVRINNLRERVFAARLWHRTTVGRAQQDCYIALHTEQHHVYA